MNGSDPSNSPLRSSTTRRPPRSKSGCLTCRRRKVRCNERRPRCSHCERLNLECTWKSSHPPRQASTSFSAGNASSNVVPNGSSSSISTNSIAQESVYSPTDNSFNDTFNYASFMWDPTAQDNMMMSTGWSYLNNPEIDNYGSNRMNVANTGDSMLLSSFPSVRHNLPTGWSTIPEELSPLPFHSPDGRTSQPAAPMPVIGDPGEKELMEYFERTVVPPIINQVETQLKWSSMRQMLISMSNSSPMVRQSILAFSELLIARERGVPPQYHQYYERGAADVQQYPINEAISIAVLEYVLATLFFLSYIDLLQGGIRNAHAHLKQAYDVYCKADKSQMRMVGKRLVSWIRLLDARAVSAGGEGLFLLGHDDDVLEHSSPATSVDVGDGGGTENSEADVEDVLFDALYQPGFVFFQKIQSFMARISLIDPWHRSRGTVKDETEVMGIAAKIGRDLNSLWEQRPPLMDYALGSKLTATHLSPSLAFAITRTFRTYYANYHASKIHLHRVAYKHLPLSSETEASVANIRSTAQIMVQGTSDQEFLPVSMLWPLLMWGSEENDAELQAWILVQIGRMEKVATNAEITGQVLKEVQTRQDNLKQRVDIRTVMHDIFNSCFAIV